MGNPKGLVSTGVDKPDFSIIDENFLKSRIYTIRGVKVMLDADLAEIYGYDKKAFNQQVKNNSEKFDADFRFQLTREEITNLVSELPNSNLKSKFLTSSWGGLRKMPFAFTEQGIYMLMTVLKGERAIAQSKALIRLFKQMKDYIVAENQQLQGNTGFAEFAVQTVQNTRKIAAVSTRVDVLSGEVHCVQDRLGKIDLSLQKVMENFIDPATYKHFLILDGQKLESDVAYTKIYSMAKKSIMIIDNYPGVKTLDLLRGIATKVIVKIISDAKGCAALSSEITADFKAARPDTNLSVMLSGRKFHDRYIFLDYNTPNEKLFHCGASSKDGGNKITTIMQVECPEVYHGLVELAEAYPPTGGC
jgi:hypothetical protein